jgi:hypothetical protein
VTVGGIMAHERALQSIANANGGTRASGTPGFDASAAYVSQRLKKAGYKVKQQTFDFHFFQDLAEPALSQVSPAAKDYTTETYQYSGSGDVTAPVQPVDVVVPIGSNPPSTSTSGCRPRTSTASPPATSRCCSAARATSRSRRTTPRTRARPR